MGRSKDKKKRKRKTPAPWREVFLKLEDMESQQKRLHIVTEALFGVNTGKLAEVMAGLERVCLTNETVEETLMNCLQAIRQTEALQAWYPESGLYKEMKVAGPHPKWVMDRVGASKKGVESNGNATPSEYKNCVLYAPSERTDDG